MSGRVMTLEIVDPLLPAWFDVVWSLGPLLLGLLVLLPLAALFIGALLSIVNHKDGLPGLELLGWIALVIFAQVIGPIVWFLVGRDRARDVMHGRVRPTKPAKQGLSV